MERININNLENIDYSLVKTGNSVYYCAINKLNKKLGVLKKNNNNDDVRELLGSQIFELCGVKHATIELMQDDFNNHFAFSYWVLKKDEKHISISEPNMSHEKKDKIYLEYFRKIARQLMLVKGISHIEVKEIIKTIKNIILVNCLIENSNSKLDNMKIIQNINSLRCFSPIAYNFGSCFSNGKNKSGIFSYLSTEEVLNSLFYYDYKDIDKTLRNIKLKINKEKINELFNQPFVNFSDKSEIKERFELRVNKIVSNYNSQEKKQFLNYAKNILNVQPTKEQIAKNK